MRVLLVVPPTFTLPAAVTDKLGKDAVIRKVPESPKQAVDLEVPEPESSTVIVLTDPDAIDAAQLGTLMEQAIGAAAAGQGAAFVPGVGITPVLATAAAAYAFDGHAVHLAGGLDPNLPLSALGLDTQFRLAGRAVETVSIGSPAVTHPTKLPLSSYLRVLTTNLTSTVQAGYLAPLFAGIVDHSLRATSTDTSALDLQRSPGGDDQPLLEHPSGAFDGAQTLRNWGQSLSTIESVKFVTSEARRIPDRRLPHFDHFIDEVWAATGIDPAQRTMLETAFADVVRSGRPQITFSLRADDEAAMARFKSIATALTEPLYWWDPDTHTLRERPTQESDWSESSSSIESAGHDTAINYVIGVQAREVPWVQTSPSILIADFTTTDLISQLSPEWVGHSTLSPFGGPNTVLFKETILRADSLIAASVTQRDFLLGAMAAVHRLDQYTYDEDPSLASLISIEDGTQAALAAIDRPVHPFEQVRTTPEYKRSPHATLAKSSASFKDSLHNAGAKAKEQLRGIRK